jgi:hypothetical protein
MAQASSKPGQPTGSAAEQERATVELAKKLSDYLRRAQYNPELHFEP